MHRSNSNHPSRTGSGPKAAPAGPMVAPVIISRVPTFQPTFRRDQPQGMDYTVTTQFGTVRVAGRLTETHRKVLDAVFTTALAEYDLVTGAKAFLVDPYKIAVMAHVNHKPQWLKTIMEDMRVAVVHIVDKHAGLEYHAGIVSEYVESSRRAKLPGGALNGERPLMVATISPAWMRIYRTSLTMRYRQLLPIINQARSGATHALALHVLTNQQYNRSLAQTLTEIGAWREGMSARGKRKVVATVREEQPLLDELGIQIRDGMVYYRQHSEVHFALPDALAIERQKQIDEQRIRPGTQEPHTSESGWSSALPDPIAGLSPSPHPSSNAKVLALPGRVQTQPLWTRLDSVEAHRAWLAQQWQAVHTQIVIVSAYLSSRAIMADGIDEAIWQAHQRGVSVMVYYDRQWASEHPKSGEAVRVLAHAGAVVQSLSRSHAKIVLVDQAAIAEGSFNWLSAERTRPDHMRWDTTVICRDPAMVGSWSQQILTQIKVLTA